MPTTTGNSAAREGLRDGWPFIFAAGPFGMLFGVVATEAGLDLAQIMGMSVVVIAGAAQFTALAQMQDAAPVAIVIIAGLAVNLRMAMYSAALSPHIRPAPLWQRIIAAYCNLDNSFATGSVRFEAEPDRPTAWKIRYYLASAVPALTAWISLTYLGALTGEAIPDSLPIDFAVPLTFLAIIAPLLRTLAHLAAALTSVVVALLLAGLPFNIGLLIAAVLAMAVGVQVERRLP